MLTDLSACLLTRRSWWYEVCISGGKEVRQGNIFLLLKNLTHYLLNYLTHYCLV